MCLPFLAPIGAALLSTGASATAAATVGTLATVSAVGSGISALSAYNQASAAKQIAANNATTAEYAARDAERRGELDAQRVQREAASLKSTQRATLAGHGLDVSYGTAGDIQDSTDFFGLSDAATVRTNAAKEAWGRRAQGANYRGESNAINPGMTAAGSLLSSAGQVASRWYAGG